MSDINTDQNINTDTNVHTGTGTDIDIDNTENLAEGTPFYRNHGEKSAERITYAFPECLTDDFDMDQHDYDLMFVEERNQYFDNGLKVYLDTISINALNKFINHELNKSVLNFIGCCYEINDHVLSILQILFSDKSKLRMRKLYVCSYAIDVFEQINLLTSLDALCHLNKKKLSVRFKKIHDDLNIVHKLSSIELKTLNVRCRFYTENYDLKKLTETFKGADSLIKFSLVINIDIKDVRKNKNLFTFPKLNNVDYLGFCRRDKAYPNPIKIDIQFSLKFVAFHQYCRPIELCHMEIKKLKLIGCGSKNFKLQRYMKADSKDYTIQHLVLKHTNYDQIHNIVFNTNLSVYEVFIQNTVINSKNYSNLLEVKRDMLFNHFDIDKNRAFGRKFLIKPYMFPTEETVNFNMIRNLQVISFKNYPTPVFFNTLFYFTKDLSLFRLINTYSYTVYEGSASPDILETYVGLNEHSNSAYYLKLHHYQMLRANVFVNSDLNPNQQHTELPINAFASVNNCGDSYLVNCINGISSHITQTFLLNRDNLIKEAIDNKTKTIILNREKSKVLLRKKK
jgi:hypothetical protein